MGRGREFSILYSLFLFFGSTFQLLLPHLSVRVVVYICTYILRNAFSFANTFSSHLSLFLSLSPLLSLCFHYAILLFFSTCTHPYNHYAHCITGTGIYIGTGIQCKDHEFLCFDFQFCINITQHCDGYYDCRDFSDEQNCIG